MPTLAVFQLFNLNVQVNDKNNHILITSNSHIMYKKRTTWRVFTYFTWLHASICLSKYNKCTPPIKYDLMYIYILKNNLTK